MKPVSLVLIAIADAQLREELSALLAATSVRVEKVDAAEALVEALKSAEAGCLLADLGAAGLSAMALLAYVNTFQDAVSIIFLASETDVREALQLIREGAFDVVIQPVTPEELLLRVNAGVARSLVTGGRKVLAKEAQRLCALLTPWEIELLRRLAAGESSKFIAAALGVAERTVTHHREHLLKKMSARNSADLARLAGLAGLT